VVTFLTMQAASVLAMGIVMIFRADPTATPGLVVVLAPVTVALAVVNVRLLLPSRGEPADEHRANGRTVATAHG
jgi:hypothetical protein